MITTRTALALALTLVAAGCGAGDSDTSPAGDRAPASTGYGYEFVADRIASPAAPASLPARVEGRLAPELIQAVVRGGFGPIAACAPRGELRVRFTVLPDGAVGEARAEQDDPAARCVADAIRGLHFPASTAGVATVVYPLVF
jgi:hypothetical protein